MSALPKNWSRCTGTDLFEIVRGVTFKKSDAMSEPGPDRVGVLRATNIADREIIETDLVFVPDHYVAQKQRLQKGDVLIASSSGSRSVVGKACRAEESHGHLGFGAFCSVWRCHDAATADWLFAFTRTPDYRWFVEEKALGININNFRTSDQAGLLIPIPPLPEQRRIVAKLNRLSARSATARDHLARTTKLATRAKQAILAAAFRGMLDRQGLPSSDEYSPDETLAQIRAEHQNWWISAERDKRKAKGQSTDLGTWTKKYSAPTQVENYEVPFDLPNRWRWVSAEEIVQPGAEIVYGIVQPGPKLDEGVPYVRGMDIVDGVIQTDQLLKTSPAIAERYSRAELSAGDVLLGIIRATKVAIVPGEIAGANITQGTARFRPSRFIRTNFLARWLESPDAQKWLHSKYRGIDMPGLNLRDVRKCPVPLAPLAVQDQIVRRIEAAFARIDRMTEEASRAAHLLDRLDERLLTKAFRGELVPQDPEDEPAEVLLARIRKARAAAPKPKRGRRKKATAE